MTALVAVTEIARNFSEYLNRVAYRGERFVLTRGKREIAELRPVRQGTPVGELPRILASLRRHLDDDELKAFARDIEESRRSLNARPVRDPWKE